MPVPIDIQDFLKKSQLVPVVDVRTPAEFALGHIPGAVNIPLFTNEERAVVGTLYVQTGKQEAILQGLAFVGPRLRAYAEEGLRVAQGGAVGAAAGTGGAGAGAAKAAAAPGEAADAASFGGDAAVPAAPAAPAPPALLVHCWRGGMRSAAMAWLFEQVGVRCCTLVGGYKAYRTHVQNYLNHVPHRLIVLGGLTGSGKTEHLLRLQASEHAQFVDLEGLANHKGSAFGSLGQAPQPKTEHFENLLYSAFSALDPKQPVWLEDESRNVGKCSIPPGLWEKMQQSEFRVLETPLEERVARLTKEYAAFPVDQLCDCIRKIERRLGFDKCKTALEACANGQIETALRICLAYYDKSYSYQMKEHMKSIRLTQFSPGAGCGCKIAPKDLEVILQGSVQTCQAGHGQNPFPQLLVGNESKDDAAVFDIGNGQAVVSTTDFFTPIVDNPTDFGRIAATNAISDIYAMGGKPLMAIAILGWPLDKLPASVAAEVVAGARTVCTNAGIPLAGGHSINSADPIFGLAVTGLVDTAFVKRNNTVQEGDLLYLTKPIGIGLISTGIKFGAATVAQQQAALAQMTQLNSIGMELAHLPGVHALTDVTGFGLCGHCLEMLSGTSLTAHLQLDAIPTLDGVQDLIDAECIPGGTYRNFASYGNHIQLTATECLLNPTFNNRFTDDQAQAPASASSPSQSPAPAPSQTQAPATDQSQVQAPNQSSASASSQAQAPAADQTQVQAPNQSPAQASSQTQAPLDLHHVPASAQRLLQLLCDPQTSGGLLIAVSPAAAPMVESLVSRPGAPAAVRVGYLQGATAQ